MDSSMALNNVKKRHLVSWNGTSALYVVVATTDSWFEVMDRNENRYRCDPAEAQCQNLQTDTRQSIDGFQIIGEAYDVITWATA